MLCFSARSANFKRAGRRPFSLALVLSVSSLLPAALASPSHADQSVQVFHSKPEFVSHTGATQISFPEDADSALPLKPVPGLLDYSCTDNATGFALPLTSPSPQVHITAPFADTYICFIGPDWNEPNTIPQPRKPTIVANGTDTYFLSVTFPQGAHAVGFELLTNFAAAETLVLNLSDGRTVTLDDSQLDTAPNAFEFVGVATSVPISSLELYTDLGALQNEGIEGILLSTSRRISIDIKPGSFPNSINPTARGSLPVAALSTSDFDARSLLPSTIRFGPTGTEAAPLRFAVEDVDANGIPDVVFHFKITETRIACGQSEARLTGTNQEGQMLFGTDSVRTVGC